MKFVWGVTFKLLKYLYTLQIDCEHTHICPHEWELRICIPSHL
jgi:hypothetical protein